MPQNTLESQPTTAPVNSGVVLATGTSQELLPNGTYTGTITALGVRRQDIVEEGRPKTIAYLDMTVEESASHAELTYGLPLKVKDDGSVSIPPTGSLAQAMALFGAPLAPGGQANDLNKVFGNRKVGFVTVQEAGSQGGTFTKIVKGSLRPL